MDALDALHNRTSVPRLGAPGPTPGQLQAICKSAFRAADHGVMRPWRFLIIEADSLYKLGEMFAQATILDNPGASAEELDRSREKALRAPLILVTISSPRENPKVPRFEQEYSAAAATQNMLLAAFALGLGAIWRTGPMARHPFIRQGLGVSEQETIIGFLYLGSMDGAGRRLTDPEIHEFFSPW